MLFDHMLVATYPEDRRLLGRRRPTSTLRGWRGEIALIVGSRHDLDTPVWVFCSSNHRYVRGLCTMRTVVCPLTGKIEKDFNYPYFIVLGSTTGTEIVIHTRFLVLSALAKVCVVKSEGEWRRADNRTRSMDQYYITSYTNDDDDQLLRW